MEQDRTIKYTPRSGKNAKPIHRKKIIECLKENPMITGVEISKSLGISINTVYKHLKEINEGK